MRDLREVVTVGLARGKGLWTAGEQRVCERMLALDGPAASLYARLTTRRASVFHLPSLTAARVDDVEAASDVLVAQELADGLVPWPERAERVRRSVLAEVCRLRGLPTTGRKVDLVARVRPLTGWIDGRWLRVRHRRLVARLERFALQRVDADRATLVTARIGVVRWPTYAPTPGAGLFRDRRALLAWEALLEGPLDAETALAALRAGTGRAPKGLDLERGLARWVRHTADAAVATDPARAEALFRALAEGGWERRGKIAVRWARAAEGIGLGARALEILASGRADALPSEHVAIGRAGRRLGRSSGVGIPPEVPLTAPRVRSVRLPASPVRDVRPRWRAPEGELPVEAAVASLLRSLGRAVVRGEGAPFSTLVALLCAELWFLPVPGALPTPFLAGPLDLGTPAFRAARRDAIADLVAAIDRGEALSRVTRADAAWRGCRLAGARWDAAPPDVVAALAEGLPPGALRVIVEAVVDRGPRAVVGMPDLAVLPGTEIRIPDAHPTKLGPGLVLVEVKGPTDAPRDEQRVWHDRLVRAGATVELWEVSAPPHSGHQGAPLR